MSLPLPFSFFMYINSVEVIAGFHLVETEVEVGVNPIPLLLPYR